MLFCIYLTFLTQLIWWQLHVCLLSGNELIFFWSLGLFSLRYQQSTGYLGGLGERLVQPLFPVRL